MILQLAEKRKLRLGERLSKWEPKIPTARQITIRDLLDMRSGIWDEGGTGPTRASKLSQWLTQNCAKPNSTTCGQYFSPQSLVDLAISEGAAAYPPATQAVRTGLTGTAGALIPLEPTSARGAAATGFQPYALSMGYGMSIIGAGGMLGNGVLSLPGYTTDLWYVPKVHGAVVVLLNSITQCSAGSLLSDATAASLAEAAFGHALQRVAEPGFPGVECRVPTR